MSLLTKDLMEQIPALYETENIKNPVVHLEIKCGNATWLITEIDKENELMFGFCEVVKGCGEKKFSAQVYVKLISILQQETKAISFGEACSMVPVFKK